MSIDQVDLVSRYADVLQIGTRNMHNFNLLAACGCTERSVLLKRGWSATLEELLLAAEYIINAGNSNVILCERGIRTHERYVRNTLALGIVPAIRRESHLPVIVDPSQGTGHAYMVPAMSRAAVAAGADGLLIEVHADPEHALTDRRGAVHHAGGIRQGDAGGFGCRGGTRTGDATAAAGVSKGGPCAVSVRPDWPAAPRPRRTCGTPRSRTLASRFRACACTFRSYMHKSRSARR